MAHSERALDQALARFYAERARSEELGRATGAEELHLRTPEDAYWDFERDAAEVTLRGALEGGSVIRAP